MANQYLLHLPDGTEYGPVDRPTLEAWSREGRLPAETLVWPEGAPQWLPLDQALAADTPVHSYAPGTWGPAEAQAIAPHGGWHDPSLHEPGVHEAGSHKPRWSE